MSVFLNTKLPYRSDYCSAAEEVLNKLGFRDYSLESIKDGRDRILVIILADDDAVVFNLKYDQKDLEHMIKLCYKDHKKKWL